MTEEWFKQESDLLASLSQWESEASRSRLALEEAEEEIAALKIDLNDVRQKILADFLNERFNPLLLVYTLKIEDITGQILVSVISTPGGELEFDKFSSELGWEDTNNIPLEYILSYFNEGLPWGSQSSTMYA